MRSCSDCVHFRFEVRAIRGKKMRGYWCAHEARNEHHQIDGYTACRAGKEPLDWQHDPSKRRFWNSYVRGKP